MTISFDLIGQRIGNQRKKMKMTQTQLADTVGVSSRTIGKIERGYDMRLSVLMAISDALDMRLRDLLDYSPQEPLAILSQADKQKICRHLQAIAELLPGECDG